MIWAGIREVQPGGMTGGVKDGVPPVCAPKYSTIATPCYFAENPKFGVGD